MKSFRLFTLFGLVSVAAATVLLLGSSGGASASMLRASLSIAPFSYTTQRGGTGHQPVGNLAVMDQSGTQDTPGTYVTFTTPNVNYQGFRKYYLPAGVLRWTVSTLTVTANYKGPAPARQTWTWYMYDWTARAWVKIGYNRAALSGHWKLLAFNAPSPRRFINTTTGEIRVQLRSNNATGNAKLDFESIAFGYTDTPTPGPTRTPGGPTPPSLGGCPVFPYDNVWNTRVDSLPVDSHSTAWINSIGRGTGLHMDFGAGTWDGGPIGIPFNVVPASVDGVNMGKSQFLYWDESDLGLYPIPAAPKIEYGSDHHILMVKQGECKLYELYAAHKVSGVWHAGSGAIWDLNSNALRPDTWTSADAAGLPILPGLVRYDEIASGEINHAIRFTINNTAGYIWPARHQTSDPDPSTPPMGARFRLKASFDISGYSPRMQVLLRAMQQYGIINADNGSDWYISGAPDSRWDNDELHTLDNITGDDFEAVDESSLMIDPNSGQANQP